MSNWIGEESALRGDRRKAMELLRGSASMWSRMDEIFVETGEILPQFPIHMMADDVCSVANAFTAARHEIQKLRATAESRENKLIQIRRLLEQANEALVHYSWNKSEVRDHFVSKALANLAAMLEQW